MSSIVYQNNVDTLCTCVVRDSLHISALKQATMRPLFSCLFTARGNFPQFELVYGVKMFLPVG